MNRQVSARSSWIGCGIRIVPAALLAGACPLTAIAQEPQARLGADVEVHAGQWAGQDGPTSFLTIDSVSQTRLFGDVTVVARPLISKQTDGPWRARVIQLAARHERPGRIGLRVEGGFLAPVVGLTALEIRASSNPTIAPALPYSEYLPPVESGAPPIQPYARTYPLGGQVSLSTARWDARVAITDSSPLRQRMPFDRDAPPAAPQVVTGGGITPVMGLRFGGWYARGPWARASEIRTGPRRGRLATMGGVEGEISFGWTRIAAEYVHGRLDTAAGRQSVSFAMVEAVQTVSPRWYVAGRLRTAAGVPRTATWLTDGSALIANGPVPRRTTGEITLGYRVSPDVTVRAGYYAIDGYTTAPVHRAGLSLAWAWRMR